MYDKGIIQWRIRVCKDGFSETDIAARGVFSGYIEGETEIGMRQTY